MVLSPLTDIPNSGEQIPLECLELAQLYRNGCIG
jgi:hypothetical protein